ncbi:chorismate mutase 1, chloroplastic-like isoform X2 [Malus sylvestris]|uniref:chorismate mutase 1, chloroplastic-like isoform X2 n=1 Tax=Malus sylvestris TaxID=3752 RepID=UPI0021AC061C|nr:chorismate mutase 1, chloroplastic-like isoform X2 [Malus sylvestris]
MADSSNGAATNSIPTMNPFSSMTTVVNIKLDRTNYPLWLAQILPILKSRDLMGYVDVDPLLALPHSSLEVQAPTLRTQSLATKKRVDETDSLTLEGIRHSLIRQEDSIIFSLLERAQYCHNLPTYDPKAFPVDGFHGSLVEHILKETEKLHGQVGRFSSPDEHPFFPNDVPEPGLPPLHYPQVLHPIANSININRKVY